ncbi:MAG: UDP-N-acetylglucosamine--N-acetylmuramyl-(pentapeptide) pyrophosphoryl-undecaprenol N-acetylglucosamine transferase [Phycisphaerae bacterium]|nr:UDP-N-acetylglucosamine--N-acetylmuramyl-(pentapeptide) pyrophosphoryl-undecaprenol N-acetylglucosamine transferase [Phycisphaerae bacterium]
MLSPPSGTVDGPVFAFAGGGTGGHLYPALALAQALRQHWEDARFVFFGSSRTIDRQIIEGAGYDLYPQALSGFSARPWRWPKLAFDMLRNAVRCRAWMNALRPDVLIASGGISALLPAWEARRRRIPILVMNPDAIPGRANRLLVRRASLVCVQWGESIAQFPATVELRVTGCPVRSRFNEVDRHAGCAAFGLDPNRRVLLVTGASLGARTLNQAVVAALDLFARRTDWQILHLTGTLDFETVRAAYQQKRVDAKILAYTDEMPEALAAADLVVSRAGASTLAEITAVGRPSILLPYPFHRDNHQFANARCLVRGGAARILGDRIDPAINGPALRELLAQLMDDHAQREQMAAAARRLGRGHAAQEVANCIAELLDGRLKGVACESLKRQPVLAR